MKENRVERDLATLGARREARIKVGSLGVNLATDATGTLQAAQEPAHTGDVTNSAGSLALTLKTVNANVGTFGTAAKVAQFVANAKGLITGAVEVSIAIAAAAITDLATIIMTLAGTQIVTGDKTFTGIVVITGGLLSIKDASDPTKVILLDLASLASGASRTITFPNASITLVGTTNTQTLSGKSLTNPKITTSTVAGLPAAATAGASAMGWVTDSTVAFTGANIGATVVGGGANAVPVRSTGAAWIIG